MDRMYFCAMDVAFYLSACQLPHAPGANCYTGFGKRLQKMGREQRGGCCLGNGGCSWHLHVAGLHTGGGRGLLAICARLSFAED